MSKLEISRHVEQGDLVIRRGNKIQKKRSKGGIPICGVWESGHERVTLSVEDEMVRTLIPRGIVKRGVVELKVSEQVRNEECYE